MRRSSEIQYVIGQRVEHRELGQCVIYGWDHTCSAEEKMGAADLAQAAGPAGLIDNRKAFVGVDSHCDGQQPFYRVQTIDGERSPSQRSHYSAQEVRRKSPFRLAVPLSDCRPFNRPAADARAGATLKVHQTPVLILLHA